MFGNLFTYLIFRCFTQRSEQRLHLLNLATMSFKHPRPWEIEKKKFQRQKYTKNELLRQTQNVWAQGVIASFCSGRSSSIQTEQFRSFAALFRLKSYITIDQEPWFLIYVLSLCYVMLHHKNTPSVFIDCSSGLPVAKAATVRRKKSMELEASWSSHKFWALPMGFLRFDGMQIW